MANVIKLRRSAVQGNIPTTAQIALGEVAINTHDGKVYIKKDDGTESILDPGYNGAIASTVAPTIRPDGSPVQEGDLWFKTDTSTFHVYYNTSWVQVGAGAGGSSGSVIVSDTAPTVRDDLSPLQEGDFWWSSLSGSFYIWYIDNDSSQWVEIISNGMTEAPQDGNYYVRQNGAWINLADAMYAINNALVDGGNLETGASTGGDATFDGGDLETGTSTGTNSAIDGGLVI